MVNKNWKYSLLSEVCDINPTKKELQGLNRDTEVSFLPMAAVSEEGKIIKQERRKLKEVIKGYTNFRDGDILLAKITPCFENGKRAQVENLVNGIGFGSTEFHVLRPKNEVTSDWIFYTMSQNDFRNIAKSQMTGTAGQKRVPTRILEQYKIPVPSIEEQENISDTIETQFTRLDSTIKSLKTIKDKLGFYRHCVLKAAFEGYFSASKVKFDEHKISEIAKIKGGKRLPIGKKVQDEVTPYPYIRVVDCDNFSVNTRHLKYITKDVQEKISRYIIQKNEVFISIAGTIGRVGMIPEELDGANLTENAAKLTDIKKILPRYLMYYLASPKAKELISFSTKSTSQPKLALFRIANLIIRYPKETNYQQEIIDEVESRFSVINKVGEIVEIALKKAERLRRSILKSAFEGKLVR